MAVRLVLRIPVLITWMVMVSTGIILARAQSASSSARGESARASNAKTFGTAGHNSWSGRNSTTDTADRSAWNPGADSFEVSNQSDGVWRVRTAHSGSQEPTPNNTPSATGQSTLENPLQ